MCLSLMSTPCRRRPPGSRHQVVLQRALAEHGQDVVWVLGAVHQGIARTHVLVLRARRRASPSGSCTRDARRRGCAQTRCGWPFSIGPYSTIPSISEITPAPSARALRKAPRRAQTARDVLGLGRLARDLRQHVAGADLVAVLDHQQGLDRQRVFLDLVLVLADDDLGTFDSSADDMIFFWTSR